MSGETSWCPPHFESSLEQSRGLMSSQVRVRGLSEVWVLCSKALSRHTTSGYSCCSSPAPPPCWSSLSSGCLTPSWATLGWTLGWALGSRREGGADTGCCCSWLRHNSQHNVWESGGDTPLLLTLTGRTAPLTLTYYEGGGGEDYLEQFIFFISYLLVNSQTSPALLSIPEIARPVPPSVCVCVCYLLPPPPPTDCDLPICTLLL